MVRDLRSLPDSSERSFEVSDGIIQMDGSFGCIFLKVENHPPVFPVLEHPLIFYGDK